MLARSVLITGTSRGLGLEFVRQLATCNTPPEFIIATCRNVDQAQDLRALADIHKNIHIYKLDVTDETQYDPLVNFVDGLVGEGGLNLLINNAAISQPSATGSVNAVTSKNMINLFTTNTVAPLMLAKAFLPLIRRAAAVDGSGTSDLSVSRAGVMMISSRMSSIEDNGMGGVYEYRTSKVGLNMVTKSLSIELLPDNILVTCIDPGWAKTDMGGPRAKITAQESVEGMLKLMHSFTNEHHGGFFGTKGKVPW